MTRRRWIADEVYGSHAALIGSHADHLANVLLARVGQEFDIVTGEDVRHGRISQHCRWPCRIRIGRSDPSPPLPTLTLVLSIFKFDRMEWAIEKCVELGAARIVPVIAQRTEAHLASRSRKAARTMAAYFAPGCGTIQKSRAAEISSPIKLKEAVAGASGARIVLGESETQVSFERSVAKPVCCGIDPGIRARGWLG